MKKGSLINGVVYRDGKFLRFINLFDEKIRDIDETQYFTMVEGGPISESCVVLVEFRVNGSTYRTYPVVVVDMYDKNNTHLTVKRLRKDEIIVSAYSAAASYINK